MASYCRVLLSFDGHPFRCLQGQIDVPEVDLVESGAQECRQPLAFRTIQVRP